MTVHDSADGPCIALTGLHAAALLSATGGSLLSAVCRVFVPAEARSGLWLAGVSTVLLGFGIICVCEGLKPVL
jgi:hypothetical protein